MEFPDIVELNVGGRHMSTLLSTLTKYPDSMLAAMFSGRHHVTKDKDGRFFIDADGDIFSHLLNFLRFETMPPSDKATQVKQYADYFGIEELTSDLNRVIFLTQSELLTRWKSDFPGYFKILSSLKEQPLTLKINDDKFFLNFNQDEPCRKRVVGHCKAKIETRKMAAFTVVEVKISRIMLLTNIMTWRSVDLFPVGKRTP